MQTSVEEKLMGALSGAGVEAAALPAQDWLAESRHQALERFRQKGMPSRQLESWKYTSLNALANLDYADGSAELALPDRLPSLLADDAHGYRLVFVDGRLQEQASRLDGIPDGVTLNGLSIISQGERPAWLQSSLGQIATEEREAPLLDLNNAFLSDGAVLRIASGLELDRPVELIFLYSAATNEVRASQPRLLVVLEANSRATVIEHHQNLGGGTSFSNGVAEFSLASGSALKHLRLQELSHNTHYFMNSQASLERDASYEGFLLALGAAVAREDFRIRLAGEGSSCKLNGVYLLTGRQHSDITSVIDHLAPHTSCDEVIKGALDQQSRGVFQGLIKVEKDAQKIEGNQSHRALLLSRGAEVNAKPELEIYADDVVCSHGATVGELDADALFYLRSRGIPPHQARKLLIEAFLRDTVELCSDITLRAGLTDRLDAKLAAMTGEDL